MEVATGTDTTTRVDMGGVLELAQEVEVGVHVRYTYVVVITRM